jgi:hypothetical protein
MRSDTSKAAFYRSQIESYERDIEFAKARGQTDRASFLDREIVITRFLLETVLVHGDDFGGGGTAAGNKSLDAANLAAAKLRGLLKSALGAAYYDAFRKGRDSVTKASDQRDPFKMAADLIAALKRAPGEARAAGAAAGEALQKARRADRKDRDEAARLRGLLQQAAVLRKDARWMSIPLANRLHVDKTRRAAEKRLAVVVAKQKARSEASQATAKHHQAMVERGVTFSRMMQL